MSQCAVDWCSVGWCDCVYWWLAVVIYWDRFRDVMFFFFKQKTAYEIQYGLVGSEMCIRDSANTMEATFVRYPEREEFLEEIKENLIVEFYNR